MSQMIIEYPDDLLVALGSTAEQFEQEAKFALAAKLFELGKFPIERLRWTGRGAVRVLAFAEIPGPEAKAILLFRHKCAKD